MIDAIEVPGLIVEHEYSVWNEKPPLDIEEISADWRYLFEQPIKVFGNGINALKMAKSYVSEVNRERQLQRQRLINHPHVDRLTGGYPINVVIRYRIIAYYKNYMLYQEESEVV